MNNEKMKFMTIIIIFLTFLIGGCGTVVPQVHQSHFAADITVFHDSLPISPGTSIKVLPWREAHNDSLEFKTFSKMLEDRLVSFGFIVLPPNSDSNLVAFFDYGIDSGTNQVSSYSIPNFGVTGYSGGVYNWNSFEFWYIHFTNHIDATIWSDWLSYGSCVQCDIHKIH